MPIRFVALFLALLASPAFAQDRVILERALGAAIGRLEAALPQLEATEMGVDVAAYRDALTLQRFQSAVWGGAVSVDLSIREMSDGSCGRFAAFVRIPPENGVVRLVLCPQFFAEGTDTLRTLTVLHEMVHVVAGSDECQAMAFAARIEQVASGRFTPVDAYWRASGCEGSGYRLP
jgi:hypothetical protein